MPEGSRMQKMLFPFEASSRKAILLCCLLQVVSFFSAARQPAWFILGEDLFRGMQVYDIIQDPRNNYYFSTNDGIYFYNYYQYEKLFCAEAKSNTMFNFVRDPQGTIYCHNLNNQVFKIINQKISLVYELSKEESKPDISLCLSEKGELLVGANKLIVLNSRGEVIGRTDLLKRYLGQPFVTKDKKVIYHLAESDTILVYGKAGPEFRKLNWNGAPTETSGLLKFFSDGEGVFALHLKSKALYSFEYANSALVLLPPNKAFERSYAVRIYSEGGYLWVAATLPGVSAFKNPASPEEAPLFFEEYFISDVFEDHEGNILFATFDKGILVVPDMSVPDVIHSFRDDPVTAVCHESGMGLILGSSRGKLMKYENGSFRVLNRSGQRPIEAIHTTPGFPLVLFDDGFIRALDKRTGEIYDVMSASLKDVAILSGTEFVLGTNMGIILCVWTGKSRFVITRLPDFQFRIYAVESDSSGGSFYASTANGLFYIDSSGTGKKVLNKGKEIFASALCFSRGKLYASERKTGIYIIEKGNVTGSIQPALNGNPAELTDFLVHQDMLIGKSTRGLYRFSLRGELISSISSRYGFPDGRVIDFGIQDNQLWVSHPGGVQQINPDPGQSVPDQPVIRLDEISVNDSIIPIGHSGRFGSGQRKIRFVFSSPTLKNRGNIRYHYKLEGDEENWSTGDFKNNDVTYNALAPGTYTFVVKTENQGVFSEPVRYSFTIAAPVYMRWWFIAGAIAVFMWSVIVIYRRQLRIQRKKAEQWNELNASRLTAIQSQMNPHFIFNALNSIQDLILKGDVEHSYSYITTFSNLVRKTLNYSDKDFIDFEQEIQLLQLYLSLEKLRFKKDLNYEISFSKTEDVMVPPLLIQPFVENALVHGLLHKEGEKKLKITFELKEDLICTIEDNGVGREKAKAIKQRQRSEHESFSGTAIRKRFEILSNVLDGKYGYVYEDLYENGQPSGTRVTLSLPFKRKF